MSRKLWMRLLRMSILRKPLLCAKCIITAPVHASDAEWVPDGRGAKPTNLEKYNKFESTSYITPDTVKQEGLLMRMTKDLWTRRRAFLWFLYAVIGVSVSLLITGILTLCNIIEKARVKATGYALKDGDVGSAYLIWVGTSLGMAIFAASLVLIEPAAASMAYLALSRI